MNRNLHELQIFSALCSPASLDFLGNLYSFCPDGTIKLTEVPDGDDCDRFLAISSAMKKFPWVATKENVYIFLSEGSPYKIGPLASSLLCSEVLPKYAQAFSVDGDQASYLIWNGTQGLACFTVTPEGVYDLGFALPMIAFSGWIDNDGLKLCGMALPPDPIGFDAGVSCVELAAIATINLESKTFKIEIYSPEQLSVSNCASASVLAERNVWIERWHTSLSHDSKPILVGIAIDSSLVREANVPINFRTWHDSVAVLFCRSDGPQLTCLGILPHYGYVQTLQVEGSTLVYLVRLDRHPGPRVADIEARRVSHVGNFDLKTELFIVDGLNPESIVLQLTLHRDQRIGFFGILSILQDKSSITAYCILSDNGTKWRVAWQLY